MKHPEKDIKKLTERFLSGKISREEFEHFLEQFSEDDPAVNDMLESHFDEILSEYHGENSNIRQINPWPKWTGLVASVVLILGFGFWLINGQEAASHYITYQTAYGEQSSHILEDSSSITLNAGSKLYYLPFDEQDQRKIAFEGEAYFDIAKDSIKPFLIESQELKIRVVGTAFNVEAYPDEDFYRVSVTEGIVKVGFGGDGVNYQEELTKGQSIIYDKRKGTYKLEKALSALWKEQVLVFHKTPFDQVIRKLERWYGLDLEVVDHSLYQLRLNGRFVDKDIHEMIRAIAYLANKDSVKDKQLIKIKSLPMN
ncbi:FecR family protein [Echinicola salinicaeni]|uniref:FecR family protein n=1 Tax=Echinicola salinicaeni TaxID=2762757 RepID=UPI0016454945|nr:FecR domain-containing protein [Echinicola salinicaeni]